MAAPQPFLRSTRRIQSRLVTRPSIFTCYRTAPGNLRMRSRICRLLRWARRIAPSGWWPD